MSDVPCQFTTHLILHNSKKQTNPHSYHGSWSGPQLLLQPISCHSPSLTSLHWSHTGRLAGPQMQQAYSVPGFGLIVSPDWYKSFPGTYSCLSLRFLHKWTSLETSSRSSLDISLFLPPAVFFHSVIPHPHVSVFNCSVISEPGTSISFSVSAPRSVPWA